MATPKADMAVLKCPACGQRNQLPIDVAARMVRRLVVVKCGRCGAPLMGRK